MSFPCHYEQNVVLENITSQSENGIFISGRVCHRFDVAVCDAQMSKVNLSFLVKPSHCYVASVDSRFGLSDWASVALQVGGVTNVSIRHVRLILEQRPDNNGSFPPCPSHSYWPTSG